MKKNILLMLALLSPCVSMAETIVHFVTPSIVRVRWNPDGVTSPGHNTGICVYEPMDVECDSVRIGTDMVYSSSVLSVRIDGKSGGVTFIDKISGDTLLKENPERPHSMETMVKENIVFDDASAHMEDTANGKVTVKDIVRRDTVGVQNRYEVNFIFPEDEALYGLGPHMEDYMNLLGKRVYMIHHNMKIPVPMLTSTARWGLLFDAGCSMRFDCSDHRADGEGYNGAMVLEAANELDYYFMKGRDMEDVAAQYRFLTGSVSMMPRYMFGYIQSKERYVSSDDLISTLRHYRETHVPVDVIVQDWNYWPQGWGYMKMDRKHYPDPKALADSIHAMNGRIMVSIWPNPQYCPEAEDFEEKGYMLKYSVYDAFNKDARDYYWKYADAEFFSNGFDAWWCDSSEPLDGDWNKMPEPIDGVPYSYADHERRWRINTDMLSDCLGAERANLYPLYHAKGIYEHQRATTDSKRVVNLTRAGYAGEQRYGTIVWNGDTHASWSSFKQQIPAGLNYFASGNPYWTVDVGSFFTRSDSRWFYAGEFPDGVNDPEYREYYTRMFQWATFLPILRSHGSDTPREIWRFGEPGTPYYDAILKMINLRYSLVPYIYSMAAKQSNSGYSMARPLAFDFPDDKNVYDLKDQYMFGDMMVCPITDYNVAGRDVYLPEGSEWIDYWSGERYGGGKWIFSESPIDHLPVFVRAGAIVPTTKAVEFTDAIPQDKLTINIYDGNDARFLIYEDDGITYDFEKGHFYNIPVMWDDKNGILTIGDAAGPGYGAPIKKMLTIKRGSQVKSAEYTGQQIQIKL